MKNIKKHKDLPQKPNVFYTIKAESDLPTDFAFLSSYSLQPLPVCLRRGTYPGMLGEELTGSFVDDLLSIYRTPCKSLTVTAAPVKFWLGIIRHTLDASGLSRTGGRTSHVAPPGDSGRGTNIVAPKGADSRKDGGLWKDTITDCLSFRC